MKQRERVSHENHIDVLRILQTENRKYRRSRKVKNSWCDQGLAGRAMWLEQRDRGRGVAMESEGKWETDFVALWVKWEDYCKILSTRARGTDLTFKRILFWESLASLATVLRVDSKRIRVEVGSEVSEWVSCEVIDMLSSEEWLDLGYTSRWDRQDFLVRGNMGWERGTKDE